MSWIIYLFKLRIKLTIRKFNRMNDKIVENGISFQIVIHCFIIVNYVKTI